MGDEVSVGRALGAGFDLIRRNPGALAAWAVVYVVIGVLPQAGMMALLAPTWGRFMQGAVRGAAATPEMLQAQAQMTAIQPLSWLIAVVCQTLLIGAAYRACLFPQERGFFYLRVGRRELWLALIILILAIGFFVVLFAVMIPVVIIAGLIGAAASGATRGSPAALFIVFPAMIAALAVPVWLGLRLSLAPAMSFAERGFHLFESWSLTRGLAWRLFATAAVIVVLYFVAELVIGAGGFLLLGGPASFERIGEWARDPGTLMSHIAPIALGFGVVLSVATAAFYAVFGAAWAEIYRQLKPPVAEVF